MTSFLLIEARRYVHYDVWRYRVRMLEEHLFANDLDQREPDAAWRATLADDLRQATTKIPFLEAVVRRLRRVHGAIVTVLLVAWAFKILVFPPEGMTPLEAMAIENIPGVAVATAIALYAATIAGLALLPIPRRAKGEIANDGDFDHKHD